MRLGPLPGGVTAVLTAGVILLPAAPAAHAAPAAPAAHSANTARVPFAGPIPQQVPVRAQAHAVLKSVKPEHEAALTEAPGEVVLTFNERVDARFTKVRVTGPDKVTVSAGAPRVDGAVVTQPLGALNRQGVHTIAFRTVSADGHLISGRRIFTYAGAPGVNGEGDRPDGAGPAPAASGAAADAAYGSGTGPPAVAGSSRSSLLTAGVAGVGLVAALSAAVLLGLRRRRHGH